MFGFKYSLIQLVVLLMWGLRYWAFGSVVIECILAVALGAAVCLAILTYDYDYWSSRGIFSPPAIPFVGHIKSVVMLKEQIGMCFKRIYDEHKEKRFFGTHQIFQRTFVVCDPDLIKRICVNDFQHFVDRGFYFNKDVDPLAGSILYLRGNEWKRLRNKISPTFSPNKLRSMFPLIVNTANDFTVRVKDRIIKDETFNGKYKGNTPKKEQNVEVDSEKLFGGYTADAIVPCAFGVKSNVMDNDDDPFAVALHAFYEMSFSNVLQKAILLLWPTLGLLLRMRCIPRKTHDFFYNIVTCVVRDRENGVQEKRGDFIDMMMALRSDDRNNNSKIDEENDVEITDMIIAANAFIIFLGGFETTSSTLAFLFMELSANPEVQKKMRKEIFEVLLRHGGSIGYEHLQELTYMEMVIQETLRLYPPFPTIQRLCTKDYEVPDSNVTVEKGTIVLFPTLGIHRDAQYFENPDDFVPERWSDGNPQPPPGVYMPFGDGPRYCIGKRFAMIQMKCCLFKLLQHVRIDSVHSEKRSGPFDADPCSPMTLHPTDSRVRLSFL